MEPQEEMDLLEARISHLGLVPKEVRYYPFERMASVIIGDVEIAYDRYTNKYFFNGKYEPTLEGGLKDYGLLSEEVEEVEESSIPDELTAIVEELNDGKPVLEKLLTLMDKVSEEVEEQQPRPIDWTYFDKVREEERLWEEYEEREFDKWEDTRDEREQEMLEDRWYKLDLEQEAREKRLSVGAIISNSMGLVLLVKRKDNEDFMPSVWEIPGGGVDPGETLQRAIEREVREETGLVLSAAGYQVINTCTYGDTVQYNFHLPLSVSNPRITLAEHSEYAWVSISDLGEYFPEGDMILNAILEWAV